MIISGLFGTTTFAMEANRQMPEPRFQFYAIPTAGPENAEFTMFLKNEGEIPLNFEFPTSQLVEIIVRNSLGEEVYRYSKGRLFLQAFQTVLIDPQKTFQRTVRWNYLYNGKRVPEGEYTVTASFRPTRLNNEQIQNRENLSVTQKMLIPNENPTFYQIKTEGSGGHYVVTGKTHAVAFYYTVEDGHNEYGDEKQIKMLENNPSFRLEIQIPVEKLPRKGSLILYLYERNQENKMVHSYPVVLERFE
jgi:hypothetical protein